MSNLAASPPVVAPRRASPSVSIRRRKENGQNLPENAKVASPQNAQGDASPKVSIFQPKQPKVEQDAPENDDGAWFEDVTARVDAEPLLLETEIAEESPIELSSSLLLSTPDASALAGVPHGFTLVPFCPLRRPPPLVQDLPVRCTHCHAFLCLASGVESDTGHWDCALCGKRNTGDADRVQHLAASGAPDLVESTVEYLLEPPQDASRTGLATGPARAGLCAPPPVVLLVDASLPAPRLAELAGSLEELLAAAPPSTPLSLVVFGATVDVYEPASAFYGLASADSFPADALPHAAEFAMDIDARDPAKTSTAASASPPGPHTPGHGPYIASGREAVRGVAAALRALPGGPQPVSRAEQLRARRRARRQRASDKGKARAGADADAEPHPDTPAEVPVRGFGAATRYATLLLRAQRRGAGTVLAFLAGPPNLGPGAVVGADEGPEAQGAVRADAVAFYDRTMQQLTAAGASLSLFCCGHEAFGLGAIPLSLCLGGLSCVVRSLNGPARDTMAGCLRDHLAMGRAARLRAGLSVSPEQRAAAEAEGPEHAARLQGVPTVAAPWGLLDAGTLAAGANCSRSDGAPVWVGIWTSPALRLARVMGPALSAANVAASAASAHDGGPSSGSESDADLDADGDAGPAVAPRDDAPPSPESRFLRPERMGPAARALSRDSTGSRSDRPAAATAGGARAAWRRARSPCRWAREPPLRPLGATGESQGLWVRLGRGDPGLELTVVAEVERDVDAEAGAVVQAVTVYRTPEGAVVARVHTRTWRGTSDARAFAEALDAEVTARIVGRRAVLRAVQSGELRCADATRALDEALLEALQAQALRPRGADASAPARPLPPSLGALPRMVFCLREGPLLGAMAQHLDDATALRTLFLRARGVTAGRIGWPRLLVAARPAPTALPRGATREEAMRDGKFVLRHANALVPAPLETLALSSGSMFVLDAGTTAHLWVGAAVAGPEFEGTIAANEARLRRSVRGRCPGTEVSVVVEGSSEARYVVARLIPSHKDPIDAQLMGFPSLRTMSDEAVAALREKLPWTTAPSLRTYFSRLVKRAGEAV